MSLDPKIADFMEKYGVTSDEIWLLPGGRSHAIKHKALERIAGEKGMVIESLKVLALDQVNKTAAVEAIVQLDGKFSITTGEAAPTNNKNAYPLAMAEKRALDRAYLKLLAIHADVYSESEINEVSEAGERSPPAEDAIEKAYSHAITTFVTDRKSAEEFYKKNKGMIQQLRVAARERILTQLKIISERENAA